MAQAIVSFFAIIDPLGNILVFHLFTATLAWRDRILVAVVSTVAAFALLLAFSLGGDRVLRELGISRESFQVAAGLLLLPPAYRLVMEGEPAGVEGRAEATPFDYAIVPLATPLIAGPGALAATTTFTQSAGRETTIVAFTLVLVGTLAAFAVADSLFRLLGVTVLRLLARIVGILLFAIAVDFVLDGVVTLVNGTTA